MKPRSSRIKPRRSTPRRTTVLRDRDYLDWLTERKCVLSGRDCPDARGMSPVRVDPAHGPIAGIGVKGPDNEAIPLCRKHHSWQHAIGWPAFERQYGFSREAEARAHYAAYLIDSGKVVANG